MSLAMLLPPMPDPVDGHLLLDGCYVNNVPADVMKSKWNVGTILAIDVGSTFETNFTNYGDYLSGFNLLLRRTFPFRYFFRSELKVPNLYDIQSRLSYVSCIRQLQELKSSDYCEYIRPPIDSIQTLHFNKFDEVKEIGYQHGKSYFSGMSKSGRSVEEIYKLSRNSELPSSSLMPVTTGYTDLAQVVTSTSKLKMESVYDASTEDEEQEGYTSEPNTQIFSQTDSELARLRRRRTGSLSDNEMRELVEEELAQEEEELRAAKANFR